MTEIYLSLGSNLGDRRANVLKAVELLDEKLGVHHSLSELVETEPWGFESEYRFINAVVCYHSAVEVSEDAAYALLDVCKDIERQLGRKEEELFDGDGRRRYHDRPVDIDILLFGTMTMDSARLTIPHRLIKERPFVTGPLKQIISPDMAALHPLF
ncbi:MAG: 2-amino-4-hydroxy-6-hydroxymethyldihydropteridine diphosphokinase [Bacteroidales bacterium]|nr:2-amino-4-hydroxy-6-hydroxymethyldihydropteridine diphosphokinase [Bacteroidales bacterium]